MLWIFIVLQTITPFVHAHAGGGQHDHAGFLHMHQGIHDELDRHEITNCEHGAEVAVAQGMPLRNTLLDALVDVSTAPAFALPCHVVTLMGWAGVACLTTPVHPPAFPEYALPPALAPPAA